MPWPVFSRPGRRMPPVCPAQAGTSTRAWATGPGTTQALLRAGVPAACIDAPGADAAQFDSEALWQRVGAAVGAGSRVLIVRGADAADGGNTQGGGRDWFARQVTQAGGSVDFVVSYQRQRPQLDAAQRRLARAAASDGSVWLFSSSEAVHNLQACLPQQDWQAARAVATHARIAEAARAGRLSLWCASHARPWPISGLDRIDAMSSEPQASTAGGPEPTPAAASAQTGPDRVAAAMAAPAAAAPRASGVGAGRRRSAGVVAHRPALGPAGDRPGPTGAPERRYGRQCGRGTPAGAPGAGPGA